MYIYIYKVLYSTSKKKEKCIKLAQPYCCLFFLVSLFYLIYLFFNMLFYFSHGFLSNTCLDIHKANNTMGNYINTPVHTAENVTQSEEVKHHHSDFHILSLISNFESPLSQDKKSKITYYIKVKETLKRIRTSVTIFVFT